MRIFRVVIPFISILLLAQLSLASDSHEKEVILQIGSKQATINGVEYELDATPVLFNNRTMVPLRFVTEALGVGVWWDASDKTIRIFWREPSVEITDDARRELEALLTDNEYDFTIMAKKITNDVVIRAVTDMEEIGSDLYMILEHNEENVKFIEDISNPNIQLKWVMPPDKVDTEFIIMGYNTVFFAHDNLFTNEPSSITSLTVRIDNDEMRHQFNQKFSEIWNELSDIGYGAFCYPSQEVWKTEWENYFGCISMSLIDNGVLLTVRYKNDAELMNNCYDIQTGELLYFENTPNRYYSAKVCGNNILLGEQQEDEKIVRLKMIEPRTNQVVWSIDIDNPKVFKAKTESYFKSVIFDWKDAVIVGVDDGFKVLNKNNGEMIGDVKTHTNGFFPYSIIGNRLTLVKPFSDSTHILFYDLDSNQFVFDKVFDGSLNNSKNKGEYRYLLDINEKYMAFSLTDKTDKGKVYLYDIESGNTVFVRDISDTCIDMLLCDKYLFVAEVTEKKRGRKIIFCYNIETGDESYMGSNSLSLVDYYDEHLLIGMSGRVSCIELRKGKLSVDTLSWDKNIHIESIVNRSNVLYDMFHKYYYIGEDTVYPWKYKVGITKYTCDL